MKAYIYPTTQIIAAQTQSMMLEASPVPPSPKIETSDNNLKYLQDVI